MFLPQLRDEDIQRQASQWDPAKVSKTRICNWASRNLQQDDMQKQ
jgi:hypothetical protein